MATKLKKMEGEEFIRKIPKRERNFSGIELEEGFEIMKNYRARLPKKYEGTI